MSEKQELAIDLNEMGSLKLSFTVQWKPFKNEELPNWGVPSSAELEKTGVFDSYFPENSQKKNCPEKLKNLEEQY